MNTKLFTTPIAFFIATLLLAQTPENTTPILSKSDVEQFITNYPEIKADFETANIDYDAADDMESMMEAYDGIDEINTIVQKHGYTNYSDFAVKSWAIASCYAAIKIEQEGMPSIQSAIDEIKANESLTDEQKELSIQQLKSVFETLSSSVNEMSNSQDIETVRAFVKELDSILE